MSSYDIVSPYSNEHLYTVTFTSYEQILQQLSTIESGLSTQQELGIAKRTKILKNLHAILQDNLDVFASLITTEMGKPISESYQEMKRALITLESTIVDSQAIRGEAIDGSIYGLNNNKIGVVNYFPLGTILCITPFNFPINLALHKLAPGFAAGNCLLFKPAPQTYLSAKKLVDCCYEAGIPQNCLQLIMPDIPNLQRLASLSEIHCISLTGSVNAAKSLSKHMGLKKFLCELGGNDPLIVMSDANLKLAAKTAVSQRFGTAGQRCNAPKQFYIHHEVYENFKRLVIHYTKSLNIGDPSLDNTDMGPLYSTEAAMKLKEQVTDAISKGAISILDIKQDGALLYPIILESVPKSSSLLTDEIFGPVMILQSFESIEAVINSVNRSSFGLQAGIFTQDVNVAKQLYQQLQVGAVNFNDGPGFRADHFPFSGVKDSGIGSEGTRYTIESMSHRKVFVI
ncbi:aldehyde dehydrogenase [bacterium]|nr:aldehyde dehydrogenase [bacterium]